MGQLGCPNLYTKIYKKKNETKKKKIENDTYIYKAQTQTTTHKIKNRRNDKDLHLLQTQLNNKDISH